MYPSHVSRYLHNVGSSDLYDPTGLLSLLLEWLSFSHVGDVRTWQETPIRLNGLLMGRLYFLLSYWKHFSYISDIHLFLVYMVSMPSILCFRYSEIYHRSLGCLYLTVNRRSRLTKQYRYRVLPQKSDVIHAVLLVATSGVWRSTVRGIGANISEELQ